MDKERRVEVTVAGMVLHLVLGKRYAEWVYAEWVNVYHDGDELWDFSLEDLLDGTIEINEDIWYWYINGRCYETTEETNEEE